MKHGTMSLRDRAAAWAFALFSAAALLAVAAQVFLGARPLQGMLPPLDQVTEFYVTPSHEDMVRFTVEENGLVQARQFREAAGITGIVLTKLDGTAKGGIAIAIARELGVPVKYAGVGEGIDDLRPFDALEFAQALI